MSKNSFPTEIRDFVVHQIGTIGELEVLLVLVRSEPKRWEIPELAATMRNHVNATENQLRILAAKNLVVHDEQKRYWYSPEAAKRHHVAIQMLSEQYETWRVAVITLIYDRPIEALRGFADAFRFRKDPKEES